ncbi:OmpW family outer membrane protein [Porticoccus sp. W117]|uniref:OmpW/AlkL family protein n=1 Tax=Porticoccus sp. W117 TaxID=3054777 RepID=UPI00259A5D9B|nr:OmpW family outer membrane protein [Porticoccus sp. W117]MDM3869791.1 OmpW family outer membrane protein [Porticoccus sp. W117]
MKNRNALSLAISAALLLGATTATAHEAGDLIVRAGVASVQPGSGSGPLNLNNSAIANSSAFAEDDESLGITATYMLTDNWGIELLAATPFEHDITANTGALGFGTINAGSTKHLPPTLSVQYFPMDNSSVVQPYVGLGVNYTLFFSEEASSTLQGAVAPATLDIDDSIGLAAEVGVDYSIDDNWLVNASVWYADIDADATFTFSNGATLSKKVEIDPVVFMLSVGYKF